MYVLRLVLEWQIASCHAETAILKYEIKSFTLQNMAFCISENIVLQCEMHRITCRNTAFYAANAVCSFFYRRVFAAHFAKKALNLLIVRLQSLHTSACDICARR